MDRMAIRTSSIRCNGGQLGHEVTYAINQISGEATNIVFGAQMIPAATLRLLPADTIVYQLEQLRDNTKPDYLYALRTFNVWDYSKSNIEFLRKLSPARQVNEARTPSDSRPYSS